LLEEFKEGDYEIHRYSRENFDDGEGDTRAVKLELNRGTRDIARNLQEGNKQTACVFLEKLQPGTKNGEGLVGHCSALVPGQGASIIRVDTAKENFVEQIRGPQAIKEIKRTWRTGAVWTVGLPIEEE